jgi:hypothetical protein
VAVGCGGDDSTEGDSGDGAPPSTARADLAGPGEHEGELSEEQPAAAFGIELAAGEALRGVVTGIDAAITVAAGEDAATEGFEGLVASADEGYDGQVVGHLLRLVHDALGPDEFDELADGVDAGSVDREDLAGVVADVIPGFDDTDAPFLGTNRGSEIEGLQFVAPTTGTYVVIVADDHGAFDLTLEVEDGDDEDLDPDDIRYLDYLAHYGEHVEFFCDEAFFGGDTTDVTNYGPTVCEPDSLERVLSGQISGDFTNDFGADPFAE